MTAVTPRVRRLDGPAGPPPTHVVDRRRLPEAPSGRSTAWWGMVLFIATEGTFGATLLASYFYVRFTHPGAWPPDGIEAPELREALIETGCLLVSLAVMVFASASVRAGATRRAAALMPPVFLLGAGFLAAQSYEWSKELEKYTWTTNAYGSFYYVIEGFDIFHVSTGLVMVTLITAAAVRGRTGRLLQDRFRIVAFYWYFVVALWIAILFTIYLSPRI